MTALWGGHFTSREGTPFGHAQSSRNTVILVLDKKLSKLFIAPQARQELMRRLLRRLPQKGDADSGAFLIKIKDFYQERVSNRRAVLGSSVHFREILSFPGGLYVGKPP